VRLLWASVRLGRKRVEDEMMTMMMMSGNCDEGVRWVLR